MNLYLVLAIALGAISGVVEAPLMRPARLVEQRHRRDRRQIRRVPQVVIGRRPSVIAALRPLVHDLRPAILGNHAPRAPAVA